MRKHPTGWLVLGSHQRDHQRQQGDTSQVEHPAKLGAQGQHTQATAVEDCYQEYDPTVDAQVLQENTQGQTSSVDAVEQYSRCRCTPVQL